MKKYYLLFFVIGLLLLGCSKKKEKFSEKSISDTLATYLTLANEDTIPYEDRLSYNKKAFAILINGENDSLNRVNLFKVANRYYNMNNMEEYRKVSTILLEKSKSQNDTLSIGKAYYYLGDYYTNTSRKDSAYSYLTKAEKIYLKLNDKDNLATVYINIATVQGYENDFLGSELSAIKALNVLRDTQDKNKTYEVYNLLGIISNELKDYEKAHEYHTKALNLIDEYNLQTPYQRASSLNNIGNVYQRQNKYSLAIDKFKAALRDKNMIKEKPNLYAVLLDNLAYSKFKLSDYSELPGLFYKSLKIKDSLNSYIGIIYSKIHLSEFYAETKDTIQAQRFVKEALLLSRKRKDQRAVLASLKQLGAVDPKKASVYSEEYIKINDSLQNAERKARDKFARIQFETDEIIQQKDKLAEQNRNILFFFGLVVMIGILLFVIKNQRSKTKELMLKQAQQKANEDIYNLMLYQQNKIEEGRANEKVRIAQELHDGILGRLFGARLNLDSLNKRQDEEAITSRNNYLVELKNIEQDIREISHDLNREKHALNNNFIGIINSLIEQQETVSQAKVSFVVDMEIEWEKIENYIKINLYRILQEALLNINKYAQAENIRIEIIKQEKTLRLTVTDDGIGFSVSKKSKGIGLQNMLSRANACEATFDIKSKIGKGTTITVAFPMEINQK
ncbi:tetratricopeptide repeat-containing sensor histidine kinase [Flavobacterium lindanitolerans]|uniref:tetratricopeptide repeat-containing sensor histidine kinase n=1 Tax=Flavobacterium lindanitolerans TaxID=428988 RepID=UPI002808C166|nr:tetratricopeptide repeat protein [Flavobacterium lindanitolerans]MDQ7960233.1 tetratricopeptide repeat protein [Flavobacterium lindanitolerans]